MNSFNTHPFHRARGFTLVEALVALVVLSIGMLGIAALYVESLRAGRTALIRTEAVNLAASMADRIRANRLGAATYAKAVDDTGAFDGNCEEGGDSASCTPDVMANHDKAVWNAEIVQALPGGTAQIDYDGTTTPDSYVITVSWVEAGQDGMVSYVMRVQI
ncbi:MAG: type IV pilus modification protein PilV [Steroidobacteraceae bacterium]